MKIQDMIFEGHGVCDKYKLRMRYSDWVFYIYNKLAVLPFG